ncbi:hypothetical protein [Haladaptatus sp. T7]|uniref:hypothetical protein n=1 Tax=Haladaptatus sp. T7 TaxID=2029368 RepID=UPI0021A255BE|nr:hypothetical protein [Haladaptatus sp. T7]GKZ15297.1 hypothetical protein HAL_31780 [Haladaptatus sp. T7]
MDLLERFRMAQRMMANPFMRRQLFLSSVIGPVQSRIHGNDGEYVMDADWDNLLILDACRYDLFTQIYAKLSLDGELSKFQSRGSSSSEFLLENFGGRSYNDTVYVTANPHEKRVLDDSFYFTDRVWIDGWSDDDGIVPPEVLSERALSVHEEFPNKRQIVHFMQPHTPFIGETQLDIDSRLTGGLRDMMLDESSEMDFGFAWEALQDGEIEDGIFWEAYRDNLIRVLEEAIPLAEELPGKTVITADHGNAIGEWATPFPIPVYFHPSKIRMPVLNTVPWFVPPYSKRKQIVRSGKSGSADISDEAAESGDDTIEERLSALGYVD